MHRVFGALASCAILAGATTAKAQPDVEAIAARTAVAAALSRVPRLNVVVDGSTYHGSSRVAGLLAKELRAPMRNVDDLIVCTERDVVGAHGCNLRENVVVVVIGPVLVSGQSATITVGSRYQEAPGIIARHDRTYRVQRTATGSWTATEIGLLRT